MLEQLKKDVYDANMLLVTYNLVVMTWGNASGIDRESGLVVIKPSGVSYASLCPGDMTVVDLASGDVVSGNLAPSTDTPAHLELYRSFPDIGGVVHTHSRWAAVYAQSCRPIPPYGTTHADYFYGSVPCARLMTSCEINGEYERETGKVIAQTFKERGIDPNAVPACLAACHGAFAWGDDAKTAAMHAAVLEEIAFMAWHNELNTPDISPISQALLDKHYLRKHGTCAYYGQGKA